NGSISLSLGKAIKENTVVGFNVGYYGSKSTNLPYGIDTTTNKLNGYNAGIFYRKYKALVKDFYFFGQANAIYSNSKSKSDYKVYPANNTKSILNTGALSVTPGLAYKIFKKTFIELSLANLVSLQYTHENKTQNTGYTTKTNVVSLSTAFSTNNSLGNV